MFIFSRLHFSA